MPPATRDGPRLSFSKSKSDRPGSPDSSHSRSSSLSKNSLQDRLFTKYVLHGLAFQDYLQYILELAETSTDAHRLLQQVIPNDDDEDETESGDKAFASSPKKPAFSLPVMANNFRRFNAR